MSASALSRALTRRAAGWALLLLSCWWLAGGAVRAQQVTDMLRRSEEGLRGGPSSSADLGTGQIPQSNSEWGGWFTSSILLGDELDCNARAPEIGSILALDTRLWGRWGLKNGNGVYARVRRLELRYGLDSGAAQPPRVYEEGLSLDLAYLDLPGNRWSFRLGRQFVYLGRGLTLAWNLDALRALYTQGQWEAELIGARTPDYLTDVDAAVGRADRELQVLRLQHTTTGDHRLFGYALWQDDRNHATSPGQGLRYDSRYTALGAEGPLRGDVSYYVEAIRERGLSFDRGSLTNRSPIEASALLSELNWRPGRRHHPTLTAGYYRGSGDGDRGSVLSSSAGNRAGTPDHAFLGLGHFEGGLALAPRLSNIVVHKLQTTYNLLEPPYDEGQLTLKAAAYLYRKDVAAGLIFHSEASLASDDVGAGFDLSLAWRPTHDFSFSLGFGRFDPGAAFATRDGATAMFSSLTYSF